MTEVAPNDLAQARGKAPEAVSGAVRVLLIDDQPIISEMVRRIVEGLDDIVLETCLDPLDTIATAERFAPTVILLDLVMPVVDGLTLLKFLRAYPPTREVPIIVLSTKEEPATKADAFAFGANDYIVKLPHDIELLARVRHHSAGYNFLLQRDAAHRKLAANHEVLSKLHDNLQLRNQFIQRTFGRYLSDEVVAELLEDPRGLELQGEKRVVTMMMTDLRGFTSLSERLPPEHVVQILNLYLGRMADVIMSYGGTVNEFTGDGILAIFGAPITAENDARNAVACALEMQCLIPAVNKELAERGLPSIEMGIALNTGSVVVGNVGSERRAKYGVVGSHINLTARLESSTVGGQVLISESTLRDANMAELVVGQTFSLQAKGFRDPIAVYEITGVRGESPLALPETRADMRPVSPPLPVTVSTLQAGLISADETRAELVRLGRTTAAIRTEEAVPVLTDLRLRLLAANGQPGSGELYAKVTGEPDVTTGELEIRFTSVSPEIESALAEVSERNT